MFKYSLNFLLFVTLLTALIGSGVIYRTEYNVNASDLDATPGDDSCGNDIGNGNEFIPGPDGPIGEDFDQVFRSLTVDPTDSDIVFVGTERNGIFKSVDGGITWQWLRCGIRHFGAGYPEVWDITISPLGSSDAVFAATLDSPGPVKGDFPSAIGGVYKSTDGGLNWERTNCGLESSRAVSISFDPNNADVLILAIEGGEASFDSLKGQFFDGGLFKSTDKGSTWNPIALPDGAGTNGYWYLYARGTNPTTFFTFGFNFKDLNGNLGFLRSNDNGATWNSFAPELKNLLMLHFDVSKDGKTIYAIERESFEIQKSIDGGESWTAIPAPKANGIVRVSPSDPDIVFFENIGSVFKSDNGLKDNSLVLTGEERIGDIEFAPSNPNVVYAAATGYNIYKSIDAGSTFTLMANLRTDVMENKDTEIVPCSNITSTGTPTPTGTASPMPTPSLTPTPTPGKSFTFKCNRSFHAGFSGIEKMIMSLGEDEECVLKLTNLEPGVQIEISTNLRTGFKPSITIDPESGLTDSNGEIEFTISAIDTGVDWIAWAIPNDAGTSEFSKQSFDSGLAWGMFVRVK
ncbi:MAG: WD40/YVTN/BNR-like repeat-containing protein [Candidatus Anammoxibacter sp.]